MVPVDGQDLAQMNSLVTICKQMAVGWASMLPPFMQRVRDQILIDRDSNEPPPQAVCNLFFWFGSFILWTSCNYLFYISSKA